MAELIPSSVRHLKSATSGERKVYQLLADAFQDDAAIIWYEPKALGRYTVLLCGYLNMVYWSLKLKIGLKINS